VTTGDGFSLFFAEQDPAALFGGPIPDDFLDSDSGFDVNAWAYSNASNTTFNWYRARMSPNVVSTSIQTYDAQGGEHTLQAKFFATGTRVDAISGSIQTVWDMMVSVAPSDGEIVDDLVSGITIDSEGRFTGEIGTSAAGTALLDADYVGDPSSAQIRIDWASTGPTDPPTIDINLGAALSLDGLTGFGASSTAAASAQDGNGSSTLDSISVSSEGDIIGLYKNGESLKLAQITLSTFINPAGLLASDGTLYQASANSGLAITKVAGENSGLISTGVLESSNVDLASEFSRLIVAQSGYQAAAKVITTSQDMLDTALNLIR
jgi:flagellar hook protein FlgE